MSWLRSAVNKAVEKGGSSNLTRTVRIYADTVVQQAGQAVIGGAKLLQDRITTRNFQNYKLAVKRLEEVSVSCRGAERVQLLRRWLVSLKEVERLQEAANTEHLDISIESNESPSKPTMVLYYDPDLGGEPMYFNDVFLHSQALEGITLSMSTKPTLFVLPRFLKNLTKRKFLCFWRYLGDSYFCHLLKYLDNDFEVACSFPCFCLGEELNMDAIPSLPCFAFRLCLVGGKEVHNVIMNGIQHLAKSFSIYNDEVLAKREELLQYAQDALAGLKVNVETVRIDSEVSNIHKKLDEMKNQLPLSEGDRKSSEGSVMSAETLKEALAHIRLCSRLEDILLQKKFLKNGDSPEVHLQKVDKLKVLSESLASSVSKAEKRISDHRLQKEEALSFRITKAGEVSQLEKELVAEIESLKKRKDELEAELKKVNTSLTSAHARLHNAREERDQFDEASNQILQHFKLKEDELSKAINSYRAEAEVCNTFVNYLEHTWGFQSSYTEQKEKLVNEELVEHEEYFMNLALSLLSAYKEELGPSISTTRERVENLKRLGTTAFMNEEKTELNSRRSLEEQYQAMETKFLTTFSVVESIEEHFCTEDDKVSRRSDTRVNELLEALKSIKKEFESLERPVLEIETLTAREETPPKARTPRIPFLSPRQTSNDKVEFNQESTSENEAHRGGTLLGLSPISRLSLTRKQTSEIPEGTHGENLDSFTINRKKSAVDMEAELSRLKLQLELENHSRGNSMDEIGDWEYDVIEKES
ncbi:hypothetical protein Adt_34454 [Abeliophyllum distichum]|uniref:Uncharacterized protein n=1 Tax=Abeliophyllum distichum TaxID=126358 RepID=A0ABD1QZ57_9LAMI